MADNTPARPDIATAVDTTPSKAKPQTVRKRTAGARTRRAAKEAENKAKASSRQSSASVGKAKDGVPKRASGAKTRAKSAKASASAATGQPGVRKLTKAQSRKTLQAELERVQSELADLRSTFEGEVDIDPEEGDVEVAERTKNISLIQMLETRERQFLDALQSVESGEYGKCKRCREDINPERLQAIPDAKYCIRCQELMERSPAHLF